MYFSICNRGKNWLWLKKKRGRGKNEYIPSLDIYTLLHKTTLARYDRVRLFLQHKIPDNYHLVCWKTGTGNKRTPIYPSLNIYCIPFYIQLHWHDTIELRLLLQHKIPKKITPRMLKNRDEKQTNTRYTPTLTLLELHPRCWGQPTWY